MHGATRKPALQHRIRLVMAERCPARRSAVVPGFDARDVVAQARKRSCACAVMRRSRHVEIKIQFVTAEPFSWLDCS